MKTTTILAVALLLALGATAAWAQCPPPEPVCPAPVVTCPAPVVTCPAPVATCPPPEPACPTACPPKCCPTELTTPCPQCPCPAAQPAALGAGPAAGLAGLECANFDKAYIEKMYNHNLAVIALTSEGIGRTTDRNLRDISGEIRTTATEENIKLSQWYAQMGFGSIPVNYDQAQSVVASLNAPMGTCFDMAYAQTLSGLLRQSVDADQMAIGNSGIDGLMRQAASSTNRDNNYIFRLDRWVTDHSG